jgi:hypothetical protein
MQKRLRPNSSRRKVGFVEDALWSVIAVFVGSFAEFRLFGIFDSSFIFFVKWLKSRSILDCDLWIKNSNKKRMCRMCQVESRFPASKQMLDACFAEGIYLGNPRARRRVTLPKEVEHYAGPRDRELSGANVR